VWIGLPLAWWSDAMAAQFEAINQPARAVGPARSGAAATLTARHVQSRALARSLEVPLFGGNRIDVRTQAREARALVCETVARATDHVNLQGIAWLIEPHGEPLVQRLLARRRDGVRVNLMLDEASIGAAALPALRALRSAGVRIGALGPRAAWRALLEAREPARALIVVDGRIALTGGVAGDDGACLVCVEGPAVAELQWLFVDRWRRRVPAPLPNGHYFPALSWVGSQRIGLATADSDCGRAAHERTLVAAVDAARDRVLLVGAGGLPNKTLRLALAAACVRGVDVHLLLSEGKRASARSSCMPWLRAGVHVHLLRSAPGAAASVVDGVWSTLEAPGDARAVHAAERDHVIVLDADFGAQAESAFWRDVARSNEVTHPTGQPHALRRLNLRLARYLEVSP
jgi:cardiolipin synthase